jgi:hypothetical protein
MGAVVEAPAMLRSSVVRPDQKERSGGDKLTFMAARWRNRKSPSIKVRAVGSAGSVPKTVVLASVAAQISAGLISNKCLSLRLWIALAMLKGLELGPRLNTA